MLILLIQSLFYKCHKQFENVPINNRQIEVYYDAKGALDPIINKRIKYYGVPHCFKFSIICGNYIFALF